MIYIMHILYKQLQSKVYFLTNMYVGAPAFLADIVNQKYGI